MSCLKERPLSSAVGFALLALASGCSDPTKDNYMPIYTGQACIDRPIEVCSDIGASNYDPVYDTLGKVGVVTNDVCQYAFYGCMTATPAAADPVPPLAPVAPLAPAAAFRRAAAGRAAPTDGGAPCCQ